MRSNKVPGIYSITTPDGRKYIGSSVDVRHRWRGHTFDLKNNKHHAKKLQAACAQFGLDALTFSVIAECKKEHLLFLEQSAIALFEPEYNTTNRADCPMRDPASVSRLKATCATTDSKARKSAAAKTNWASQEYRQKYETSMRAVRATDGYKAKMSASQKERRSRPEEIEKYRAIHSDQDYRKAQSEKTRLALSRPESIELRNSSDFKERHSSAISKSLTRPEVKEKVSAARKKMWSDPEFRERRLANIREYTSSPEYKLKMSIAVKAAKERKKNESANTVG